MSATLSCLLATMAVSACAPGAGPGAGPGRAPLDPEWQEMVASNPYPETCAPVVFDTKTRLRLCIREHMWIDEMPSEMPRMNPGYYNFKSNRSKILPPRRITDPKNRDDCLRATRTDNQIQPVPYDCYSPAGLHPEGDWPHFDPFYNQISRDLRYTFDFVLHEDPQLYIENNFWYLILYLKKIAMELPNPFELIKLAKSTADDRLDAKSKLAELREQVSALRIEAKRGLESLYRVIEGIKKTGETLMSNRLK